MHKQTLMNILQGIGETEMSAEECEQVFHMLLSKSSVIGGRLWTDEDVIQAVRDVMEMKGIRGEDAEKEAVAGFRSHMRSDIFDEGNWKSYRKFENAAEKSVNEAVGAVGMDVDVPVTGYAYRTVESPSLLESFYRNPSGLFDAIEEDMPHVNTGDIISPEFHLDRDVFIMSASDPTKARIRIGVTGTVTMHGVKAADPESARKEAERMFSPSAVNVGDVKDIEIAFSDTQHS